MNSRDLGEEEQCSIFTSIKADNAVSRQTNSENGQWKSKDWRWRECFAESERQESTDCVNAPPLATTPFIINPTPFLFWQFPQPRPSLVTFKIEQLLLAMSPLFLSTHNSFFTYVCMCVFLECSTIIQSFTCTQEKEKITEATSAFRLWS